MKAENLFDNIPANLPAEVFQNLVSDKVVSDKVRIERILSFGHSSPEQGWYDQDQNEWVMVQPTNIIPN